MGGSVIVRSSVCGGDDMVIASGTVRAAAYYNDNTKNINNNINNNDNYNNNTWIQFATANISSIPKSGCVDLEFSLPAYVLSRDNYTLANASSSSIIFRIALVDVKTMTGDDVIIEQPATVDYNITDVIAPTIYVSVVSQIASNITLLVTPLVMTSSSINITVLLLGNIPAVVASKIIAGDDVAEIFWKIPKDSIPTTSTLTFKVTATTITTSTTPIITPKTTEIITNVTIQPSSHVRLCPTTNSIFEQKLKTGNDVKLTIRVCNFGTLTSQNVMIILRKYNDAQSNYGVAVVDSIVGGGVVLVNITANNSVVSQ